jgi:hypothetical protein
VTEPVHRDSGLRLDSRHDTEEVVIDAERYHEVVSRGRRCYCAAFAINPLLKREFEPLLRQARGGLS